MDEEVPRLGNVTPIEQSFTLRITSLNLALVGVIDLVGELDDVRTVIDFKTADSAYQGRAIAYAPPVAVLKTASKDRLSPSERSATDSP